MFVYIALFLAGTTINLNYYPTRYYIIVIIKIKNKKSLKFHLISFNKKITVKIYKDNEKKKN